MSGVYWGLTALHLLGRPNALDGPAVVAWVLACQRPCGGWGGSERHDAHLLYTLSALQILALYDELDRVDADAVARCEPMGWSVGWFFHAFWNEVWRIATGTAASPCHPALSPPPHLSNNRRGGPAAARWLLLGRQVGRDRHALLLLCALRAVADRPPGRGGCRCGDALRGSLQEL